MYRTTKKYDAPSSVTYDNYFNHQISERNRTLFAASTTYFKNNLVGNHSFKVGAEYAATQFPSVNFTTGTPSDPSFCPTGLRNLA